VEALRGGTKPRKARARTSSKLSTSSAPKTQFVWGSVRSWDADVMALVQTARDRSESHSFVTLTIKGDLTAPLKNCTTFILQVSPDRGPADGRSSIGCILKAKAVLDAMVYLLPREFELLQGIAIAGRLTSIGLTLEPPRYGHGLIYGASFSTQPPEQDESNGVDVGRLDREQETGRDGAIGGKMQLGHPSSKSSRCRQHQAAMTISLRPAISRQLDLPAGAIPTCRGTCSREWSKI